MTRSLSDRDDDQSQSESEHIYHLIYPVAFLEQLSSQISMKECCSIMGYISVEKDAHNIIPSFHPNSLVPNNEKATVTAPHLRCIGNLCTCGIDDDDNGHCEFTPTLEHRFEGTVEYDLKTSESVGPPVWLRITAKSDSSVTIELFNGTQAISCASSVHAWILPVKTASEVLTLSHSLLPFEHGNILNCPAWNRDMNRSFSSLSFVPSWYCEQRNACPAPYTHADKLHPVLTTLHEWSICESKYQTNQRKDSTWLFWMAKSMKYCHQRIYGGFNFLGSCFPKTIVSYFNFALMTFSMLVNTAFHAPVIQSILTYASICHRQLLSTSLTYNYLRYKFQVNKSFNKIIDHIESSGDHSCWRVLHHFARYTVIEKAIAIIIFICVSFNSFFQLLISIVAPVGSLHAWIKLLSSHLINSPLGIKFHKWMQDFIWLSLVNNISDIIYTLWTQASVSASTSFRVPLQFLIIALGLFGGYATLITFMLDIFRLATIHLLLIFHVSRQAFSIFVAATTLCWKVSTRSVDLSQHKNPYVKKAFLILGISNDSRQKSPLSSDSMIFDTRSFLAVTAAIGLGILAYVAPSAICFFVLSWLLALCRVLIAQVALVILVPMANCISDILTAPKPKMERLFEVREIVDLGLLDHADAQRILFPTENLNLFISQTCLRHSFSRMFSQFLDQFPYIPGKLHDQSGSDTDHLIRSADPLYSCSLAHEQFTIRRASTNELTNLPKFIGDCRNFIPMTICLQQST